MEAVDRLGVQIKSGDKIVYPIRSGSQMWLNVAIVTGIEPRGDKVALVAYNPEDPTQRRLNIRNLHTVAVVGRP